MSASAPQPSASQPPQPDPTQILFHTLTGYIASAALQTAVKLGVADHLSRGPQSTVALAKAIGANEDALYRVLRALAVVGIFQETEPRTFALTPSGELLRSDQPGFRDMALWITSPFHFRVYSNLIHSVRTGEPAAEHTIGMPVFDYLSKDQELSSIFNNAMTAFSASVIPAVLDAYDFTGIHTLVDVGGGHGYVLTSILQKYPSMRGILTDIDHVIAGAHARVSAAGVQDRITVAAGDMFKAVPEGGDAYIMKHIIHDWDDDRASVILGNIHKALGGRTGGRVILLEGVIQAGNVPDLSKLIDLEMLAMPGGRERTEEEFRALFARSGFELTRVVPTQSPLSVVEARPQ
jgi:hypothetical protein